MKNKPYLIISNDDGYTAGGINFLIETLRPLANLLVVAPDQPRSGQGCAFTLSHTPTSNVRYFHVTRNEKNAGLKINIF